MSISATSPPASTRTMTARLLAQEQAAQAQAVQDQTAQDPAAEATRAQDATGMYERVRQETEKRKTPESTAALQEQAFMAPLASIIPASPSQDALAAMMEQNQVQATSAISAASAFANGQAMGQSAFAPAMNFAATVNGSYAVIQQILSSEPSASDSLDLMA